MSTDWTWQGEEFEPDAEIIRACIDAIFAEAGEYPLTDDERVEVSGLYDELDEVVGGNYRD